MTKQLISLILAGIILLIADFYIINGIKSTFKRFGARKIKYLNIFYWSFNFLLIAGCIISIYFKISTPLRTCFLVAFFLVVVAKVFFLPFILVDDVRRILLWISRKFKRNEPEFPASQPKPDHISRSEFLIKTGLVAASLPLASLSYGIISGAYDYRVKRQVLYLPRLPRAFEGMKLGQLSDIHSGSFYNKKAVLGGVEMLMKEKPDIVFFTGDLVNNTTSEMLNYQDIFAKVKAPLGVYAVLGNHDYGEYYRWPSAQAKRKNFEDILTTHKNLGWNLLMNENRRIKVDGEEIGVLGVENWGTGRFPKLGRMDLAIKNTDDLPVKLLLSHDPSHWRAEILKDYPQVDAMFSGHTHGMQFGVQTEHFKWSPVQYLYKEWSGLYRENNQQLFVNVGYGFLGYPGRIGVLPEITIFELRRG